MERFERLALALAAGVTVGMIAYGIVSYLTSDDDDHDDVVPPLDDDESYREYFDCPHRKHSSGPSPDDPDYDDYDVYDDYDDIGELQFLDDDDFEEDALKYE